MTLGVAVEPHLGRPAAFDDIVDFLVQVAHGMQSSRPGHFHYETSPFALGAGKLNEARVTPHPLPVLQRKVLNLANSQAAENGDILAFEVQIVGRLGALKLSKAGSLVA